MRNVKKTYENLQISSDHILKGSTLMTKIIERMEAEQLVMPYMFSSL